MRFDIMTLFPEMIDNICSQSIIGRAISSGIIEVRTHNIRDFSNDKHRKTDDTPYGGGMGMLMTAQPVNDCFKSFKNELSENACVVYMSPKGSILNHNKCVELSKYENIVILCGHYEGIDQRIIDTIVDEEISIGDYVLTGGELPAAILVDSVSRLIPNVLSASVCYEDESIAGGLLEYPQYTKPYEFEGLKVPDVLLGGNHDNISKWRRHKALEETLSKRPDLLETAKLSKDDILYLDSLKTLKEN